MPTTELLASAAGREAAPASALRLARRSALLGAAARQAILTSADGAPHYADTAITALANRIAAEEGVPVGQVMVGSGSGELLRIAALPGALEAAA